MLADEVDERLSEAEGPHRRRTVSSARSWPTVTEHTRPRRRARSSGASARRARRGPVPPRRADRRRRLAPVPRAHRRARARPAGLRPQRQARRLGLHDGGLRPLRSRRSPTRAGSTASGWSCTTGARSACCSRMRAPERIERLVIIDAVPLLPGYRWHRIARDRGGRRCSASSFMGGTSTARARPAPRPTSSPRARWSSQRFDQGTSGRSCACTAAPPEDVARRARARGSATRAPRSSSGASEDPYLPRASRDATPTRLRGDPTEVLTVPDAGTGVARARHDVARRRGPRRFLAVDGAPRRVAGCRSLAAAATSLLRPPSSADLAAQTFRAGLFGRDGLRALGQRVVRRPPAARLQRPLPAAGRAARRRAWPAR